MPRRRAAAVPDGDPPRKRPGSEQRRGAVLRSEEHTSELQSRSDLVCRLLLEKKKKYAPSRAQFTALANDWSQLTQIPATPSSISPATPPLASIPTPGPKDTRLPSTWDSKPKF